ncbi:MAG: uroporphyrinogen decarboxylase family protein [Bacillota bacterium]|jgi:MtaA/CmuA family methyltransferase
MNLSQKDRLIAAVHRQPVDRPPCICPGGMMNMMFEEIMNMSDCLWPAAHTDPEKMAGLAYALNQAGGFENYGVPFCMTVEAEAMGAQVDIGSLLVEPHVVNSPLQSLEDVDKLQSLDVSKGRVKVVIDAIKILKAQNTDVPIVGNITGPISTAGTLVDMSVLLKEYRKKPETAHKFMTRVTEEIIKYAKAEVEAGADMICISEPSGTGEILGPKFFREYSVKYVNMILDAVDVPVKLVHICGSLSSVYDIIPEFHSDAFSFDAIVPIAEIKPHIPEKAVVGNINTHAIGTQMPEKIRGLVRFAKSKGIDVVAPACGLPTTTPLINVQTMVKAAAEE